MKVGDVKRFRPTAYVNCMADAMGYPVQVEGRIVGFHRGHRWYRVEYRAGESVQHECFPLPVPPDPDPPSLSAGHRENSRIMTGE